MREASRSVGARLTDASPALGIVGASLWIAWITIIYSADATFPAGVDVRQTTADAFVASTLALGVSLIVLSFVPTWTARRLLGPRPLMAASLLGAMATVAVLNGPALSFPLFTASAAATGMATAPLALKIAQVLSEVETKGMLVAMGSALILGLLVYALDMMLLLCQLRPLAAVVLVLLLPLAAAVLSQGGSDGSASVEPASPALQDGSRLSAKLVRLIVFIAMMLFLLSLTRGYYPNLMELSQFATSRCVVCVGLIAAAAVMVMLAWASPRNLAFGTLFYGLLLGSVLVVLVLALLNVDATVMGDVSSVLYGMTSLCLWALLCRVSFRSGRSAVQVVGIGFGAACLGTTAGVGVGSALYAAGMPTAALSFVMAGAVILCVASSLFLLRIDDVKALMQPDADELDAEWAGVSLGSAPSAKKDAPDALVQEAGVAAESPEPATVLDEYQASLRRLCAVMAVDYGLSTREVDVLELLVVGKDAKAIADELFISFNTVRSHIRRIYVKLDVHSRQELLDLVKEAPRS